MSPPHGVWVVEAKIRRARGACLQCDADTFNPLRQRAYTAVGVDGLRQDFRFVFADPDPVRDGAERAALQVQVVRQGLQGAALRDATHGPPQGAAPHVFLLRASLPLGDESAQPPRQLLPAHERDHVAARGRRCRRRTSSVAEVVGSRPVCTDVVVPGV